MTCNRAATGTGAAAHTAAVDVSETSPRRHDVPHEALQLLRLRESAVTAPVPEDCTLGPRGRRDRCLAGRWGYDYGDIVDGHDKGAAGRRLQRHLAELCLECGQELLGELRHEGSAGGSCMQICGLCNNGAPKGRS